MLWIVWPYRYDKVGLTVSTLTLAFMLQGHGSREPHCHPADSLEFRLLLPAVEIVKKLGKYQVLKSWRGILVCCLKSKQQPR